MSLGDFFYHEINPLANLLGWYGKKQQYFFNKRSIASDGYPVFEVIYDRKTRAAIINFSDYSFKIIDQGTAIEFEGQTIKIEDGQQILLSFDKDRTMSVQKGLLDDELPLLPLDNYAQDEKIREMIHSGVIDVLAPQNEVPNTQTDQN
ncbi:MAG: hypothetical protein FWH27_14005 [Planctomycetaceae bacterium]|nr:hypothetical protein [Planctomycetaceae bacterium]